MNGLLIGHQTFGVKLKNRSDIFVARNRDEVYTLYEYIDLIG
jgi:hypothetical protein